MLDFDTQAPESVHGEFAEQLVSLYSEATDHHYTDCSLKSVRKMKESCLHCHLEPIL